MSWKVAYEIFGYVFNIELNPKMNTLVVGSMNHNPADVFHKCFNKLVVEEVAKGLRFHKEGPAGYGCATQNQAVMLRSCDKSHVYVM